MSRHENYVDFVNALLENTPEEWDGDDAAEAIAIDYVRHLEAEVTRLGGKFYPCAEDIGGQVPAFLAACTPERLDALSSVLAHYSDPDARRERMILLQMLADLRAAVSAATGGGRTP